MAKRKAKRKTAKTAQISELVYLEDSLGIESSQPKIDNETQNTAILPPPEIDEELHHNSSEPENNSSTPEPNGT